MESLADSTSGAKRRKLKHGKSSERMPGNANVPCLACRSIAVDHRSLIDQAFPGNNANESHTISKDIDLSFHLEDQLPDLRALQTSFENGCDMCGELRASLTKHPSFQSFSKLRSPSQSPLEIRLQASLQCESSCRARSVTFRADLVSGTSAPDHQTSPQLIYEVFTGESTFLLRVFESLPTY